MTPEPTPLVTVTPADREAAAHLFRRYNGSGSLIEGAILSGAYDHDERVQIVARHRLAALEEAAKVAETLPIGGGMLSSWINTNESPMGATRRHIATAIRALSNKTGEGAQDSAAFARPTDPSDAEWSFWLNDAASILQSNGTETHAEWVRKAAGRIAASNKGGRDEK